MYKAERNCHFPGPGSNCMNHRQTLQIFLIRIKHRSMKTNQFTFFIAVPAGSREQENELYLKQQTSYKTFIKLYRHQYV